MNWGDLLKDTRFILPLALQAVLPGPAGALVGTALASLIGAKPSPADVAQRLAVGGDPVGRLVDQFVATNQAGLNAMVANNQAILSAEQTEIKTTQGFAPMLWGRAVLVYVCGAGFLYAVVFSPLLTGFLHQPFPQPNTPEIIAMLTLLFGHGLDKMVRAL